jgi:hypothetical protein
MALLKGRFGYYQPRTPEEKIRARRREERRRQEAAAAAL